METLSPLLNFSNYWYRTNDIPARIRWFTEPKDSATQCWRIVVLLQLLKYLIRIAIADKSL